MGLYRNSDVRAFMLTATLANVLVITGCFLIAVFHFYETRPLFRDTALVALTLSIVLRLQLSMQKTEILEKRIANILNQELPGGKLAASSSNLTMVFYLSIFWIGVVLTIIALLPKGFTFAHFFS